MNKYIIYLLLVMLFSCDKDGSDGDSLKLAAYEKSFENIRRGGLDDVASFSYFSLAKNDTVAVTNPTTSAEWDLGFGQRTAGTRPDGQGGTVAITQSVIVINGGVSGNAEGKGFLLTDTLFEEIQSVTEDLDDSLAVDTKVNDILTPAIETGSGTWYTYDPATHLLAPNPTHTILIKTADGKYAKVQILEIYYKDPSSATPDYTKSGYFTIIYVLQEDPNKRSLEAN